MTIRTNKRLGTFLLGLAVISGIALAIFDRPSFSEVTHPAGSAAGDIVTTIDISYLWLLPVLFLGSGLFFLVGRPKSPPSLPSTPPA